MIKVFAFDYGSFDSKLRLIQLLGILNIIGFLRIVAFDVSKAFNNVWYPGIIYKLTTCGILVNYSELFLHFSVKNYVTLSEKYSQDCVVNAGITLFLDQHFSFYKMTIFLMIMISRALQMFLWYHTERYFHDTLLNVCLLETWSFLWSVTRAGVSFCRHSGIVQYFSC